MKNMIHKINEILEKSDHNYAHEFAKELSLLGNDNSILGFRTSGSSGELKVAQRIEKEMKKIGLKKVSMDEFPVHSWEFTSAYLELLIPERNKFTLSAYCVIRLLRCSGDEL